MELAISIQRVALDGESAFAGSHYLEDATDPPKTSLRRHVPAVTQRQRHQRWTETLGAFEVNGRQLNRKRIWARVGEERLHRQLIVHDKGVRSI
jgi:hypothetical protein